MKSLASLAACCAVTAALGYGTDVEDATLIDVELAAGAMHEECMRLESGQKRAWHWKANAPVDFNVHYHQGSDVSYPVKRNAMRGDGGTFIAKTQQDYCWMWTAKDKPARVEGKIQNK